MWRLETKKCSRVFFFKTPIFQKKILRFDPTLSSNNYGLKNYSIKNHQIFGIARTSAFIWHIWIPLKKICKRTRRVCVCIVLVHFGPFPQEVNEKSVKLAVWAVSLNFLHDFTLFVVDIHQIRLISLFRHFSDHFHFHPILEQKRVIDLNPCHNRFVSKGERFSGERDAIDLGWLACHVQFGNRAWQEGAC